MAISDTHIFVVDSGNHRIQIFNPDGSYVKQFSLGVGNKPLLYPGGIALNSTHIFVADTGNHTVQIFDLDGRYADKFGVPALDDRKPVNDEFRDPAGIALNSTHIFVAELNNHRIQIFRNAPPPTAPGAADGLVANAASTEMHLIWTKPATDGGADITDYIVQYRRSADDSWSTFGDSVSDATSATVTKLSPGVSYDFRVAAENSVGTGPYSNIATTNTTAQQQVLDGSTVPGAPPTLGVGNDTTSTAIDLIWTAPEDNGGSPITNYIIEYAPQGLTWSNITVSNTTSYTVTNLSPNTVYYFLVYAKNAVGTGPSSLMFLTAATLPCYDRDCPSYSSYDKPDPPQYPPQDPPPKDPPSEDPPQDPPLEDPPGEFCPKGMACAG